MPGDGPSDAEREREALGLSPEDRATLSRLLAPLDAPADPNPIWEAVVRAQERRPLRTGALMRLAIWQVQAEPARVLVPLLTALLIIGAEWLSVALPDHGVGVDVWAVTAPWLGVWAFASGAGSADGALGALTAMAPIGHGQRHAARWLGAAATAACAIAVALGVGASAMAGASPTASGAHAVLSTWAKVAAVGFVASLAAGLLGAATVGVRRAQAWAVGLGLANLAWVVEAIAAGHPGGLPALLLVRAPLPTAAGVLAASLAGILALRRRWITT
jgi:hypothetical protein